RDMQIMQGLGGAADQRPAIRLKPQEDSVLIQSIAQGNRLAMQVLFTRYKLRIFRFALRRTNDEAAAEDVLNEVFLQVWRDAGRFNGRSQVATWLFSMTRN